MRLMVGVVMKMFITTKFIKSFVFAVLFFSLSVFANEQENKQRQSTIEWASQL